MSERSGSATIPCLFLSHGIDEINCRSLASVVESDSRLSVDVIHNPSDAENGQFLEFARKSILDGSIRSLTTFDENISNNSIILYLLANRQRYSQGFIVLTDGDILVPKGAIEEQLKILNDHSHIFACGLRIDASRWSDGLPVKSNSYERFNTAKFETADYVNSATGLWMAMFRGPELFAILDAMQRNRIRLTDGNIKQFAAAIFQKSWVATKQSVGRELNRERHNYYSTKAESTKNFGDHSPEPAGSRYATWNHDIVSPATEWLDGTERRIEFEPLPTALPRFRPKLEDDPVASALARGELEHRRAYLINSMMNLTQPGLALVLTRERCASGFRVDDQRSVLFISEIEEEAGPTIRPMNEIDFAGVLVGRSASQGRTVLGNLGRFVSDETVMKGVVYIAEAMRNQLRTGSSSFAAHLASDAKDAAIVLANSAKQGEQGGIAEFVAGLWTDEAFEQYASEKGWHLSVTPRAANAYLANFEVRMDDESAEPAPTAFRSGAGA